MGVSGREEGWRPERSSTSRAQGQLLVSSFGHDLEEEMLSVHHRDSCNRKTRRWAPRGRGILEFEWSRMFASCSVVRARERSTGASRSPFLQIKNAPLEPVLESTSLRVLDSSHSPANAVIMLQSTRKRPVLRKASSSKIFSFLSSPL
ncbi:hypothetical protein VTH06DRAFT_2046 [Thermothelomyces fergusii]